MNSSEMANKSLFIFKYLCLLMWALHSVGSVGYRSTVCSFNKITVVYEQVSYTNKSRTVGTHNDCGMISKHMFVLRSDLLNPVELPAHTAM